jgi:hypothetical protein
MPSLIGSFIKERPNDKIIEPILEKVDKAITLIEADGRNKKNKKGFQPSINHESSGWFYGKKLSNFNS